MPRTSDPKSTRAIAWKGMSQGWAILSELIAALAVWGGIGFGLDRLFGTCPVLFAIGMVVGYGGGAYLMYRRGFAPPSTARKEETKP